MSEKTAELLTALLEFRDRAADRIGPFADAVEAGGFAPERADVAGLFFDQFRRAARAVADDAELAPVPWNYARSVAIEIVKTAKRATPARMMVEALLAHAAPPPPDSVREALGQDLRRIGFQLSLERLVALLEANEVAEARRLAESLLAEETDEENRKTLQAVLADIDLVRSVGRRQRRVALGIAGVLLLALTAATLFSALTGSDEPAPVPSFAPMLQGLGGSDGGAETVMPYAGAGGTLTRPELRYCQRTLAVIKTAAKLIDQNDPWHVEKYKAEVGDYGKRCAKARFAEADMQAVTRELEGADLRPDAERMIGRWEAARPGVRAADPLGEFLEQQTR